MLKEVISHIFYEGIEHHKHLNLSIFTTKFQYNMLGQLKTSSDWFHIYALRSILSGSRSLKQAPSLFHFNSQKQPFKGVFRKRCFENMQQIYRRTAMPKQLIEDALRHWCSPVNLLHIFRVPSPKNTSGEGCFWIQSSTDELKVIYVYRDSTILLVCNSRKMTNDYLFFFFNICSETCCKYEIRRLTWL